VVLPSGTVTFLFTDVEGSTELLQRVGAGYGDVIDEHRRHVRTAVAEHGGEIVDARGEEFFVAFADAAGAVAAAVAIQRAHAGGPVRVRVGLHTGEPTLHGDGYLGIDLHRAARICSAGHGGQVLISPATRDRVPECEARDLGAYTLHGIAQPQRIFQLLDPSLPDSFPALRVTAARTSRLDSGGRRPRRIDELGWQVRGRMPGADDETRAALAELGASLFAAERTAADADRLLALVDRRLLERRLREHTELGALSRAARDRADVIRQQLDDLDAVGQRRRQLADVASAAGDDAPLAAAVALAARVRDADVALGAANDRARTALDDGAWRLRRTVHRGIYRAADRFAVPFVDETGVERIASFDTMAEARAYRRAQRLREKTFSTKHELDAYYAASRIQSDARIRDHAGGDAGAGAGADANGF
jgi:class 3 adenylate cyclase